jgi:hypothetical protein
LNGHSNNDTTTITHSRIVNLLGFSLARSC